MFRFLLTLPIAAMCSFWHDTPCSAIQPATEIECDLLVVGGTESGWAATIQAARMGVSRIVLVNDIEWLGGQYTAEAVCALDENRGINRKVPFHRSGLFAELTTRFEQFNLEKYGHSQPGNAWTARTTVRPAEAEAIFREMLQPYLDSSQVQLISQYVPVQALMDSSKSMLEGLVFQSKADQSKLTIRSSLTIDASDWGDAVKLSGAEYEYGVDYNDKYNEPNAPTNKELYSRTDMNPITWCMVIEETDEPQLIEQPLHYDDRNYYLTTNTTEHEYLQLGWQHRPHRPFNPPWMPSTGTFYSGDRTVYSQRRLIDSYGLDLKGDLHDVILLNWSVQDYPLDKLPQWVNDELEEKETGASKKNIVEMTAEQRQIVFEDAKRHSLGMLYHLQTTVHDRMTDEQKLHSFRRFRLSREFGTPDHLPPKPYIRESLRLKAMYMMREQDTRNFNRKDQYATQMYYDGIAAWQFPYDFHPTGRAFQNPASSDNPWEIYIKPRRTWNTDSDRAMFPLRSLIPFRVRGLLGAQKNLGYSSIVSSAVRLHDQCVHIGQACGALAAVSLDNGVTPRVVPFHPGLLQEVRLALVDPQAGTPMLLWPFGDLAPNDDAYVGANMLAVSGILPLTRREIDFRANTTATSEWQTEIMARSGKVKQIPESFAPIPKPDLTRGEFVAQWWELIGALQDQRWERHSSIDFDSDGIPNLEDAQPFDSENKSLPEGTALPLPPEEDGIPEKQVADNVEWVKKFNFAGKDTPELNEYFADHGLPFDNKRTYGWKQDISDNNRRRGAIEGDMRDTFLFTRGHDVWELAVPIGVYRVTICVGDSGHEQNGHRVTVEDKLCIDDVPTASGRFHEATVDAAVVDEKLTIELGKKNRMQNTCLNWIKVEKLMQ